MIALPRAEMYDTNIERYECDTDRCIVCGKPVKSMKYQVHLWYGAYLVTEDEAVQLPLSGDTGFFPIGSNCIKSYLSVDDAAKYVSKVGENKENLK